jgi:WhiB family redox-sensing transcriptional regulator
MADFSRLPGPNADLWDWQLHAACRGVDSALFFHPEGERGAARISREESAKEVCTRCPVLEQCAAHALKVREPYGVWGGLTEDDRVEMDLKRRTLNRKEMVGVMKNTPVRH